MADYIDFFHKYIMSSIQIVTGFYYFTKFLKRKNGSFLCHTDWQSIILYAALTVEIMQLSYGIVNSLSGILYPLISSFHQEIIAIIFLLLGNSALLLAVLCYRMVYHYFSYDETIKQQNILIILTPMLMIFLVGTYISSIIYGNKIVTNGREITEQTHHCHLFVIQLLSMVSLFCILSAYRKLLQNFRLNTELSLLEQEERSLNQYVEEAKVRYEKTRSFRHDIKNHITVVKDLLQNGRSKQALNYVQDMADITQELSFPCYTNNPVADILIGNKLGMAKNMGIHVNCSLFLPYPCFVRDIDFCIVLSNALDNAITACKNITENIEKYICVSGRVQGDFILLEVQNSFQQKELPQKGTGLTNVKAVAEKYHGAMSIKTQGTTFLLSVLLIIPQHAVSIPQQID